MKAEENSIITRELLESAMSYESYSQLLDELFNEGKTTGDNHSEAMLGYAKMNIHRMNRLNKTIILDLELIELLNQSPDYKIVWLVLTEGWCGDAAQNIPLLQKVTELSEQIELKLILRDENLPVMDQFLTNGGRSIPKLIALREDKLSVLGEWGPRPEPVQQMVNEFKKQAEGDYKEFSKEVQLWYARNKNQSLQAELKLKLKEWGFGAQ